MNKLHVRKDDTVVIISGKDKGKKGKVIAALPKESRVVVENANMIVRHTKPRQQGQAGGRIKQAGTIAVSNVMLWCKSCDKATRAAHKIEDGKTIRVCKKCGKEIK